MYLKGDHSVKLPIDLFLEAYLNYSTFNKLNSLTMPLSDDYVSGYEFMSNCVWPVFEDTIIKQISFTFGLSSLPLFRTNYTKVV